MKTSLSYTTDHNKTKIATKFNVAGTLDAQNCKQTKQLKLKKKKEKKKKAKLKTNYEIFAVELYIHAAA